MKRWRWPPARASAMEGTMHTALHVVDECINIDDDDDDGAPQR